MLLGVDVGGTFTDAALLDDERLHTAKVPTTPEDQSRGVMSAVEEVLGRAGQPSFPTTWDDVLAHSPDLVVVAPCGFDADRAAREAHPPDLPCPAVAVDANAYYSRPAPRIADGVRQLAHLVHPDLAPDPGLPAIPL